MSAGCCAAAGTENANSIAETAIALQHERSSWRFHNVLMRFSFYDDHTL
jgi:hypothetical protein